MRTRFCLAAGAAFLALNFAPAALSPAMAADQAPVVIYGAAPAVVALPPVGYVLDPSDARRPVHVVNQGPTYGAWVGAIAQPTYSEGGYIYLDDDCPEPYVARRASRSYPYVRSYHGGRVFTAPRAAGRQYHGRRFGDAAVGGLAAAYRYRPAPSARIIHVEPRPVPEMHTMYRPR
ncbi:hypothetical protein RA307_01940 [Xanthobacteraceae bacterium Astr-EGSB]|uniref:hypothetical protein n=1 Tax=Astrobacterium formosum TaxID=3069710 RepID=UPI0027B0EA37|nr:hypothetical protein [Xanthobacteraceae bacterium Astr-EGSB]